MGNVIYIGFHLMEEHILITNGKGALENESLMSISSIMGS
jgi:hypothetical protein